MKVCGIYMIQSIKKPKRVYIGSAGNIHKRKNSHLESLRRNKHHSVKLQNHFNKYGEKDLVFSVLLGCDEEDLLKTEQYFIDTYNPWFNILKKAVVATKEIKERQAKRLMGNKVNLGRKHTPEHNLKISMAQRGKNNSMYGKEPWIKGKHLPNPNKGKKGIYSEETLAKMRVSNQRAWDRRKLKISA